MVVGSDKRRFLPVLAGEVCATVHVDGLVLMIGREPDSTDPRGNTDTLDVRQFEYRVKGVLIVRKPRAVAVDRTRF